MADQDPWYRRCLRWGQTNITEIDPTRYDIPWWLEHWRRTAVQGVIVNAGGIVAYYPSALPQHRAHYLEGRDLFGELRAVAREDKLAVIARMDCNRVREPFYSTHPDWCAVGEDGRPYRSGEFYFTCINSPYYDEFIPRILHEVIERYRPDGFGDNSWSGMWQDSICYCEHCRRRFFDFAHLQLPERHDWGDDAFRRWIDWSYRRRIEVWDLFNQVASSAGGPDCLWLGMLHGSMIGCAQGFRDIKSLCERSRFVLLDFQTRERAGLGFTDNADQGALLNDLLGWGPVVIEAMAMYQSPEPTFRLSARPAAEARLWMAAGAAGTIQPWWHHIGAYHEDRRQYGTAEPFFAWHQRNERFLIDRKPVANIGVVWSQRNLDFFGRNLPSEVCVQPYQGVVLALVSARIPYVPVHIDNLDKQSGDLDAIILPNIGAMSDAQAASIESFAAGGKGVMATGDTSRCDVWGEPRADFRLAELFGVHAYGPCPTPPAPRNTDWESPSAHTYLRLYPELRERVNVPHSQDELLGTGRRHPVLIGFDETDILPFGGRLTQVSAEIGTVTPLTFIPAFPIYPPETSWMRIPATSEPGLVLRETEAGGRVAYMAAGIDQCIARDNLPDHCDLVANIARWLCPKGFALEVLGPGLLDCRLYHQPGRMIVHLVNLTNPGAWRAPVRELVPRGPCTVRVKLHADIQGGSARALVGESSLDFVNREGWVTISVPSILDHEVLVIE